MPAACQSFLLQPSTFAFSRCEGAKRQRLCRTSGNPAGVNLAGVSLFRMRAHGWHWGLWRAFGTADAARCCSGPLRSPNPLLHPSTFAFKGFEGAKRQRLCRPSRNPVGVNLAGVSLFRMRAHGWRWGLWRAFGTADAARCCSGPLRSPNQCLLLAKASCFTRPPLLLGGSKVPNGSGSANQVATCWAEILLVSLFRMRAHGWRWGLWRAFGMADAARFCSRPLRPPNQCLLLAKASCFTRPPLLLKVVNSSGSANLEQSVGFESCWGFLVSDGRLTCLWNGCFRAVLPRAVPSAQPPWRSE